MPTTHWTIENVGVEGGAEKSIKDWGIDDVSATFISQAEDEVTLSASGRRMDAAYLFPYKSTVIIRRDRELTAEGWTGGTPYFTGICAHPHVGASPRREFHACSIVGPWWFFNERGFEQEYREVESVTVGVPTYVTPNPTKSRIFLNLKLGEYGQPSVEKLHSGQQTAQILAWVLKPFTDTATPAPFTIGTIGIAVDAPVDEVKNITCAEAVRKMLRWSPDAVAWFDHSTSPPTFHIKRRADLVEFNLDIRTLKPTGISIVPRFDLQRPYVRIQYEITDSDNGVILQRQIEDVYPDPLPEGAMNQFAGVPFVVDLRGYTAVSGQPVTIQTAPIDTASAAWWLLNAPDYNRALTDERVTEIDFDFASVQIETEGEAYLGLPRQLVRGVPSEAINASWQRCKATIKAAVTYANGAVMPDKTFSFQFTATNAVTGTYGGGGSFDEGDPVPVNLAQDFYNAVAHVPYKGKMSFREAELGTTPKLGHKLNVAGSANADWLTMNTIVQRVTENVHRRTSSIEFGTPPHLDVGDLVSLLRVTRHRDPQNPYSIRVGGGTSAPSSSGLRSVTAIHNNSNAAGNASVTVASGSTTPETEEDTAKMGVIKLDGPNKRLNISGHDDDGEIDLAVGTAEDTARGELIKVREVKGKNASGEDAFALFARSPSYTTRKGDSDPDFICGGGEGSAVAMQIQSVHDTYLTCRTWDGSEAGSTDILVAKPLALQTEPDADDEVQLHPAYAADGIIWALPSNFTGVEDCDYIDINRDARRWLTRTEGCDEEGNTKVAYFLRTNWETPA